MGTLALAVVWITVHLSCYFLVLRASARLNAEKVIVAYHLSSWSILGCWLIADGIADGMARLEVPLVAALGLHGIYSMTFWETWGSSEGGFSLRIMDQIDRGRLTRTELLAYFEKLGEEKRTSRLDDLQRFWLVKGNEQRYDVGVTGIVVVSIIRLLHLLGNVRKAG